MNIIKKYLPTVLFNTLEFILLLCIGILLRVDVLKAVCILLLFTITRNIIGAGKHYKSPFMCLVWSSVVFLILFYITKIDFVVAIVLTVFCATAQTGKVDVHDMFMWNGRDSQYDYLEKYVDKITDTKPLEVFENKLKTLDENIYNIYKYRFKDKIPFTNICEKMNKDKRRICEGLKTLELAMNLYFDIK